MTEPTAPPSAHPQDDLPIQRMGRERALQLLYERDLNTSDVSALDAVADCHMLAEEDLQLRPRELDKIRRLADALASGVQTHRHAIDDTINQCAEHWTVDRMLAVDRNVMRIAVYEMQHTNDVPRIVSINEAIDLAKQFGGEESGTFVNGVLDRVYQLIESKPATSNDR